MREGRKGGRPPALSGYRIMWLLVLFDLPVGTKTERRRATRFRHALLDMGFEMSQFSNYLRFCPGKEAADAYIGRIEAALPPSGKVHVLQITDKQFEKVRTFKGRKGEPKRGNPDQLVLF
ncbi:MAG: CRISPR-associated endonuclease Cas2 [Rhodospirillales bacterium]